MTADRAARLRVATAPRPPLRLLLSAAGVVVVALAGAAWALWNLF